MRPLGAAQRGSPHVVVCRRLGHTRNTSGRSPKSRPLVEPEHDPPPPPRAPPCRTLALTMWPHSVRAEGPTSPCAHPAASPSSHLPARPAFGQQALKSAWAGAPRLEPTRWILVLFLFGPPSEGLGLLTCYFVTETSKQTHVADVGGRAAQHPGSPSPRARESLLSTAWLGVPAARGVGPLVPGRTKAGPSRGPQ